MAILFDDMPVCDALAAIAQQLHQRGWMPGTAGNLSRCDPAHPDSFWITASGNPKGQLEREDFLRVTVADGAIVETPRPANRPSAETSIHQAIYRLFPQAQACLHVHTVAACIATQQQQGERMALPPLEVIKGMGIWQQHPQVALELFDNWLEVPRIAEEIYQRFSTQPPAVPALMIRDHGLTVWGESLQQAYNRLEIMEFIMAYLARQPG